MCETPEPAASPEQSHAIDPHAWWDHIRSHPPTPEAIIYGRRGLGMDSARYGLLGLDVDSAD